MGVVPRGVERWLGERKNPEGGGGEEDGARRPPQREEVGSQWGGGQCAEGDGRMGASFGTCSGLAPEVRVPQLQGQVPLLERLLYLQRDSQPLACTESSWEALSRMET